MPVKLKCPSCGHIQQVPDEVLGKKVRCPSCNSALRVAAPKTGASAERAAAATEYEVGPAVAPVIAKPLPEFAKPAVATSRPAAKPERAGLPAWAYAVMGGSGVMALIAAAVLIRFVGGATSSRYPDPSVDVVVGVASVSSGQPAAPGAAPAAAPTPLVASNVMAATMVAPVAGDLPDSTPSTPAASDGPAPSAPASGTSAARVADSSTPTPAAPVAKAAPKTTAEIVARSEASVALVKGHASSGTGFVVKPGVIATNAHVIDGEFISNLEIRFPSAPQGKQGPFPVELLFEDPKRDLAFLGVASEHSALEIAATYTFLKGEDVMVIGNPGLGDEVVLENAISRGVIELKGGGRWYELSATEHGGEPRQFGGAGLRLERTCDRSGDTQVGEGGSACLQYSGRGLAGGARESWCPAVGSWLAASRRGCVPVVDGCGRALWDRARHSRRALEQGVSRWREAEPLAE